MAQPNRAILALCSILAGAAAGTAVGAVGVWLGKTLMMSGSTVVGDPRNAVFAGYAAGALVALFVAWAVSAGLTETWRRAAIAFVACIGALGGGGAAFGLSMLSLMSPNPLVQYGVPILLVLSIAIAVLCFRAAKRQRQLLAEAPTGR